LVVEGEGVLFVASRPRPPFIEGEGQKDGWEATNEMTRNGKEKERKNYPVRGGSKG